MSVKPVIERPYMQEEWFAVLKAEAEKSNLRAIAETTGYSKTTIGMVLKGQYPGKTDNVAASNGTRNRMLGALPGHLPACWPKSNAGRLPKC